MELAEYLQDNPRRLIVCDGGMGSCLLKLGLTEADYGGHPGCHEYLCWSRPEVIAQIHADYFAAVEELSGIARGAGKTLVELAFQWLLSQPVVDSIILGASRLEQLEENLKACEGGRLDGATLARCDAVWKRLRGITPKYNR